MCNPCTILSQPQVLLHWARHGAGHRCTFRADRSGPGGVTPLHLAALNPDPRAVLALLDTCPPEAFTCLVSKWVGWL